MSKTPKFDAKVKAILDATQPGERVCSLSGKTWEMTEEEIGWYKKFNVPPHPWAPFVRLQHIIGFPSGAAVWKKPHAKTGKEMLSFVHPDSPFQVIEDKEWFNEEFAQDERELDPQKPFFDQFWDLATSIPVGALRDDGSNVNTVGVDVINARNSYLCFGGSEIDNLQYTAISHNAQNAIVTTNTLAANNTYMANACAELHNCRYCFQNGKLVNCTFCFSCSELENCFGASNQRFKKYLFFNEQLSQGEWEKRVSKIDLTDQDVWDEYVRKFHDLVVNDSYWPPDYRIEPYIESSGEYLLNATRCRNSYWHDKGTDLYYSWIGIEARDSAFTVWHGWGDRSYMSVDLLKMTDVKFSFRTWRCQSVEYSSDCYDCENLFGCFGLRKKKFHIFNKPYSEDEYWKKLDEIKCAMLERGEYGMFFPSKFSQGGFQFSMGDLYLDYTDEQLKMFDAPTFDATVGNLTTADSVTKASELPKRLEDCAPYVGKPILDEQEQRMYVVRQREYDHLKTLGAPFPRQHFLPRIKWMFQHSNTPVEEPETCRKCNVDVTTYRNAFFSGRRRLLCRPCYMEYRDHRS